MTDVLPNQTIYLNNVYEKLKKEGEIVLLFYLVFQLQTERQPEPTQSSKSVSTQSSPSLARSWTSWW